MNQGHSPSPTYSPAFSLLPRPPWGHSSLYLCPNWELLLWWPVLSPGQSLQSPKRQPVRVSLITFTDVRRSLLTEGRTPPGLQYNGTRRWALGSLLLVVDVTNCSKLLQPWLLYELDLRARRNLCLSRYFSQGIISQLQKSHWDDSFGICTWHRGQWLVGKALGLACFDYVSQKTSLSYPGLPNCFSWLQITATRSCLFKVRAMLGSQEPSRSKLTSARWSQRLINSSILLPSAFGIGWFFRLNYVLSKEVLQTPTLVDNKFITGVIKTLREVEAHQDRVMAQQMKCLLSKLKNLWSAD